MEHMAKAQGTEGEAGGLPLRQKLHLLGAYSQERAQRPSGVVPQHCLFRKGFSQHFQRVDTHMWEAVELSFENVSSLTCDLAKCAPPFTYTHFPGTSLAVQWLSIHLPRQRVWVRLLVWELRTHLPHSRINQVIKQKQHNKF